MRSSIPTRSRRARWFQAAALGTAAVLVLGACGGDDDDDDNSSPTTVAEETDDTAAPGDDGDEAASGDFCEAYVTANDATAAGEGDPTPALEAVQAAAPDEIADDVATMIENAPGEQEIPPQEFFDANEAIGEYVEANCDFSTVEVTGSDYAFEGIPEELGAGTVLVKFTNEGEELHELVVFRKNDGEERSITDLLALPEEEAMTAVTPVTGFAFALPGGTFYTTYTLEEGSHGAVCFIPTGLTPEAAEAGEVDETAPPHHAQGMAVEFEVTA